MASTRLFVAVLFLATIACIRAGASVQGTISHGTNTAFDSA